MVRGNGKNSIIKKNISFVLLLSILASIYPVMVYAQATSIIINTPQGAGRITSHFGRRVAPRSGASSNHRGTDFAGAPGTVVRTNAPVNECVARGKAGNVADVYRKCADGTVIKERYFHLQTCSGVVGSTSVRIGSTGNVTGPHLHYEIVVGGSHVDPEQAFGKNLCDPVVRRQLYDHAKNKGIAGGGGGSTAPSNPSTPPSGGGTGTGGPTTPPPVVVTPPPPAGPPYEPRPYEDPIDPDIFPPTTDEIVPGTVTDNEVTGCSTEVWRAMVNKSVLQTRREMLMNERYIAKADSVLAYSCFEDFYWHAGETVGVFSETDRWNNAIIDILGRSLTVDVYMGTYSLDAAIASAVDAATQFFLDDNFDHEFLGGLLTGPLDHEVFEIDEDNGTDDHDHGSSQYGYTCGKMREVWNMAKCHNVTDDPMFYTFEDLVNYDPRIYPHNYACIDSGIKETMIDRAKHEEVTKEVYTTYFDILRPESDECAPPIPTGVQVTIRTGTDRLTVEKTYDDGLCITAGCTYQNPDSSGLGTCEIKQP